MNTEVTDQGNRTETLDKEKRKETIKIIKCRLFISLMGLLAILVAMLFYSYFNTDHLNSFVFSVIAGCGGGSISIVHRLITRKIDLDEIADSWFSILLPLAYAGGMAMIAYLLFMGGILTGEPEPKKGLFSSNLFPVFDIPSLNGKPLDMEYIFTIRPKEIVDFAKLLIWSFLAGYSERFIIGLLSTLERQGSEVNGSNSSS